MFQINSISAKKGNKYVKEENSSPLPQVILHFALNSN